MKEIIIIFVVICVLFVIGLRIVIKEGNLREQMIRESFGKEEEINELKQAEKQFYDSLDEKNVKNDLYFHEDDLF